VTAALIAALCMTASCRAQIDGALAPSGATIVPRLAPHGLHIEAATWVDGPWPFTVAQGDLACTTDGGMQMQTFTANGVTYALNSAAKGGGRYPPVDAIWRQDPNLTAAKVNIAEVLDYARSLCPG
jgi:hypothetical protein